jgi:DNA adenine methylase|tara:strand:- start:995 stop:1849 length:855 start_codon:yes stop_codon:yes gene_type:complete
MLSPSFIDCPIVIPYYGGKYEMSRILVPLIPPHQRYIEVFAGGLSMFFRKTKAKWNVLNDIDNNIVNLYMCVINKYEELIKTLFWLPKSRKLFIDFREEVKEKGDIKIPDPYIAAKYLYCIRNSFNKLIHTPFSKVGDMNRDWDTELNYSRKYLGGATIENLDFAELIEKYPPREEDFWYLDPPYFIATDKGDYYMNNFSKEDHFRFKEAVDKINEGGAKFMISYDYREEVKDLYSNYNIEIINWKYAGTTGEAKKKPRKEFIVMNYKPTSQIHLFNKEQEYVR